MLNPHTMKPTTWRPEDGHLLHSLRTQAGLDEHAFARHNTLSLAQLKELETGVGHHFYNDLIKRNAGVKLLKKLGYEFPEPQAQAMDTLALEPNTPAAPGPEQATMPVAPADIQPVSRTQPAFTHPGLWIGGLLTTGLVAFVLVQGQSLWTVEGQQTPVIPAVTVHSTGPAPAASASAPDAPVAAAPNTPAETPQALSAPQAPPSTKTASAACDDAHRNHSASHTPSNPLKPGNYVYIEAHTDNQLCVLDSQNKLSILSLKAGMNHTVNGLAPFLLHASDWQGLQVFFQGRPVRIDQRDSTHLVLNSLPL